jgi:hypothetical protein
MGSCVVASCTASSGESSAAKNPEIRVLSRSQLGGFRGCPQVFDMSRWKDRARGRKAIIASWYQHGAFAVCRGARPLMLQKFGNATAPMAEVTTYMASMGEAFSGQSLPRDHACRIEGR